MGVDDLRSCYEVDAKFFTDSDAITKIRWYFTNKPKLPFVHKFGSRNWLGEGEDNGSLGEVEGAPRKWVNGAKVGSAPGTHWCGTEDQWQNGTPLPPDPPIPLAPDGTPTCCFGIHPVAYSTGGQSQGFDRSSVGSHAGQRQGGRGWVVNESSGGQAQSGDGGSVLIGAGGQAQRSNGQVVEFSSPQQEQSPAGSVYLFGSVGQEQGPDGEAVELSSGGQQQQPDGSIVEVAITGEIIAYAGSASPTGYLPCDGAAVSRSTYAALFTAIGTTWGVGDGSTTFNVPDLRGRSPIGSGTGSGLTARTLAGTGGEESHPLITAELAAHTHAEVIGVAAGANSGPTPGAFNTTVSSATNTGSTGSGTAHNTMHPYRVVNFQIKT